MELRLSKVSTFRLIVTRKLSETMVYRTKGVRSLTCPYWMDWTPRHISWRLFQPVLIWKLIWSRASPRRMLFGAETNRQRSIGWTLSESWPDCTNSTITQRWRGQASVPWPGSKTTLSLITGIKKPLSSTRVWLKPGKSRERMNSRGRQKEKPCS